MRGSVHAIVVIARKKLFTFGNTCDTMRLLTMGRHIPRAQLREKTYGYFTRPHT